MFTTKNKVRIHDTDMAGILYFPRMFRFAHDAHEDFMEHEGFAYEHFFHRENFIAVVVHCEADYPAPMRVGDLLIIEMNIIRIGETSFTVSYEIFKEVDKTLVGKVKTVHVTLDWDTRKKISIPQSLRDVLQKHLIK